MTVMLRNVESQEYLPRLPSLHLPRPRLSAPQLASLARVRLLCAPAGSGKTVLLAECARACPADCRVHWLPLDGATLSVEAFCAALAEALGLVNADEGELLRHLAHWHAPIWILLDDYCRQPAPELDACLDRLLAHSSPAVTWWIASRRRPQCNLPRLLIDGDLVELDGEALALTQDEIRRLLALNTPTWTNDAADRLAEQTLGWCAGVRMGLLEPGEWGLAAGAGSGHSNTLNAYLEHELFGSLSAAQSEAWRVLMHLPRFNAGLCEYLLGAGEGQVLLQELHDLGGFIEAHPEWPGWLRVFAPLAQHLRQRHGAQGRPWHLRACQWFAAQGDWQAAVEHALLAGQAEAAVSLLQHFGSEHLFQGRNVALLLRLRREQAPLFVTLQSQRLLFGALLYAGRLEEAEACLAEQARFTPQPTDIEQRELLAYWQAQSGYLAHLQGDSVTAGLHLREAMHHLPEHFWDLRLWCLSALTQQALLAGQLDHAQSLNREALLVARQHASLLYEAMLEMDHAQLLEQRGALARADAVLARAQDFLMAQGRRVSPMLGRLALRRGRLALRQGEDDKARQFYQVGLQEALEGEDQRALYGFLGLASLDARRGKFDQAFQRLREAERLMQQNHNPENVYRAVLLQISSRLMIMQGRAAQAYPSLVRVLRHFRGVDAVQAPPATLELIPRLECQLALAEQDLGEGHAAQQRLLEQLSLARPAGMQGLVVELQLALGEVRYLEREWTEATATLREALALAQRLNLRQPVCDLFARHPRMEAELGLRLGDEDKAVEADTPGCSPLSLRELDVLRLIAQGCSNQQIAQQLFISLHTVKTHARRINVKLGVERRTQAVATAKGLGLLV